jgi:hypothetical protein
MSLPKAYPKQCFSCNFLSEKNTKAKDEDDIAILMAS